MPNQIDFTDLENELMDYWNDLGVHYCDRVNVGFSPPDPDFYQTYILPKFQEILDDPMICIAILGFDSIANYLLSKEL